MKFISKAGALCLAALTVCSAGSVSAATMIVDDATFGVGTVLLDTDNNVEFLQLSQTMGYGYNGVLAELGVGGDFEGWSVASTATMEALGVSAGVTQGSTDAGEIAIVESLRDFFCPTGTCVNTSSSHVYARGLVSDALLGAFGIADAFSMGRRLNVTPNEVDFRISGFATSATDTNEEVWLVRDAQIAPVPLPASSLLLLAGIGGLAAVKRRKS